MANMLLLPLLRLLFLGCSSASPASILQLDYDVAAPFVAMWRSQIVQITADFGSWGVSAAPEWVQRDYHRESWTSFDTTALVSMNGFGLWASAFLRPFESTGLHRLKFGAYARIRQFRYAYDSYGKWDEGTHFQQSATSWALGGEAAMTFHPTEHIVLEPYAKVGIAHYDLSWSGTAPAYPHPSEFRYTWDPDVRTGLFAGWEF
jgi:hypothetical protein